MRYLAVGPSPPSSIRQHRFPHMERISPTGSPVLWKLVIPNGFRVTTIIQVSLGTQYPDSFPFSYLDSDITWVPLPLLLAKTVIKKGVSRLKRELLSVLPCLLIAHSHQLVYFHQLVDLFCLFSRVAPGKKLPVLLFLAERRESPSLFDGHPQ